MLDKLEGKKTYIVSFLVATYALVRAFFPDTLPDFGEAQILLFVSAVFAVLRAVTWKPGTLAKKTEG